MDTNETSLEQQQLEQQQTMTMGEYQESLAALQQENEELRDKYLRSAAAIDNTRKQAGRDAAERVNQRLRNFFARLLEVVDNLERALAHVPEGDPVRPGLEATLNQLESVLRQEGVTPIAVESGTPFDPALHEAIDMRAAEVNQPTVAGVLQTGYMFDGQVLRPARVIVHVPAQSTT